jgi:hypothetical protein
MAATIPDQLVPSRTPNFTFLLALALAAIAFGGFAPTYFRPVAAGTFSGPVIVHLHGALSFGWMLLFVAQTRLAVSAIRTHRALGLLGISLATAMVFAAFVVIVDGLNQAIEHGSEYSARVLSVVPITGISAFAIFFALAIANLRRPEYHQRFMIMATIALLPPAAARIFFVLFAPDSAGDRPSFAAPVADLDLALRITLAPALLVDLLILVPLIRDWKHRGGPHPVYVVGGSCLIALHVGRMFFVDTALWRSITNALIALAR